VETIPMPLVACFVALLAALGLALALCVRLLIDRGRLLLRIEALETNPPAANAPPVEPPAPRSGAPAGSVPNDFELPLLSGGRAAFSRWRGRPLLLLFVNPACAASRRLLAALAATAVDGRIGKRRLLIVSTGSPEANRRLVGETGIQAPVLLQDDWEVGALYRIEQTPAMYRIDRQGRIDSPLALGGAALALALHGREADPSARPADDTAGHDLALDALTPAPASPTINRRGLPPGSAAPAIRASWLDGGEFDLAEWRGRDVLLVFWEPDCPACDGLAPDLAAAQSRHPDARVALIARGDPARLRQAVAGCGLPVVVQRNRDIALAFGTFETPAAYLLRPDGAVAAAVAVGAERVRQLAERLGDEGGTGQGRAVDPVRARAKRPRASIA
jgi:thiol-disulfide isomerase/thioredoxin